MSDYKYEEASALDAAASLSIGNALRNAREARGETLLDVAHALKLAPKQVEALEQERFDLLPGRAFVRGFLRNYARHLGLDASRLIGRLADSSGGTQPAVELSPPKNARGTLPTGGVSSSKAPRSIVVVVLVMAVALGLGWYFDWFKISEVGRLGSALEPARPVVAEPTVAAPFAPPSARAELPAVTNESAGQAAPAEAESSRPAVALDPARDTPSVDGAVALTPSVAPTPPVATPPLSKPFVPEPLAQSAGQSTQAARPDEAVQVGSEAQASTATASATAPAQDASAATEQVTTSEPGQLTFKLRGESWIQVRDASGNTIYMGTGAAGTTRIVNGTPPFNVVVGNATQVAMEHAGKPIDLTPHIRTGVARLTVE